MYFALLDILRFLSSLAVLIHHTFDFHYGKLGVYLFFVISGFVIYFSLGRGLKEFAVSRFLRLYPLFWVCCTLTYIVTIFYHNSVPFHRYLQDMLLVNDGQIAKMVDGSYWTLTFEVLFYCYVAVFVYFFSKQRLEWFYALWLAVAFLSFYLKVDQHIIFKLLSVRFAPYFVFGGVLALCVDRYKTSGLSKRILFTSTLACAALMPLYVSDAIRAQIGVITNITGSFDPDELMVIESFFIMFPLIVYLCTFNFAKNKTFGKVCFILGGITYPLYLLHWKIGYTLITSHGDKYGSVTTFSVFVAMLLIVVSLVLSLYEVKVRKFLKNKLLA